MALLMIMSLLILFIYLLPVIMGTRGIWGLSRRSIAWAIGFTCCSSASTPS